MVGAFIGLLAGYVLEQSLKSRATKNIMAGSEFLLVIVLMVSLGIYVSKVTKPTLPANERLIKSGSYTIFIESFGIYDGKNITVIFSISKGNVVYTKVKDVEMYLVTKNEEKINANKKIIRDFQS